MKSFFYYSKLTALSFIILAATLSSCDSSKDEPDNDNTRTDIQLTPATKATANQLQGFYTEFTADAVKCNFMSPDKASDNVIVSPFSASMLLGMIANGVEEPLAAQIASYIGVEDLDALNMLSGQLLSQLPSVDRKTTVNIANSLWTSNKYRLSDNFLSVVKNDYKAATTSLDFSSTQSATINKWIASNSNGFINNYFESVAPNTIALILNSVYFNGEWASEYFRKDMTSVRVFHGLHGDNKVEMMTSSKTPFGYCSQTEKFETCEIYFGNNAFSLQLILPTESYMNSVEFPLLTSSDMQELSSKQEFQGCSVVLPKFKLSSKSDLNTILDTANLHGLNESINLTMFNPIIKNQIELNQITSFSINEKGAEAATVSSGVIGDTAYVPNYSLTFDRPFYFFIREFSTGACLLSGFIADL